MSKQRASKSNSRTLFVVLVAAGALVLTLAAVLLLRESPTTKPVAPDDAAASSGASSAGPRLAVAQAVFDYGDVKVNTPIETVFRLSNTGDAPLQILEEPKVEVVEGC